jgi:hypothetical protein
LATVVNFQFIFLDNTASFWFHERVPRCCCATGGGG